MPDIETVIRGDEQTCSRLSTGELGNASSEIPIVIYFNRCGQIRSGCRSTARVCLGDGCGRGADHGRMVGLCVWLPCPYLHLYFRFKLHLRPFPEASKHIGDELPSLPPDKVASTFSQTFPAPTARISGSLLMNLRSSSS